jgi:branched-chain amino acid aminotransferase
MQLVEANHTPNATLRVVVVRNRGGAWEGPGIERDYDTIAFTTATKDWGESVRLGLVKQARHADSPFAGTKMLSWSFNLIWLEEAQRRGYDEVVLLNERGEVSECTSANIFASYGSQVWTPPLSSGCLPGITRELLIGEVSAPGVTVGEKALMPADLESAESVFITSTTRQLLPVDEIDGLRLHRRGTARELLQEAFSAYVDRYVSARRATALPR